MSYKKRAKGSWNAGKLHKEDSNRSERQYSKDEIRESLKNCKLEKDSPYWTLAYSDVVEAIEREICLIEEKQVLLEIIDTLIKESIADFEGCEEDTHEPWDGTTFTAPEIGTYIFGEVVFFQEDGSSERRKVTQDEKGNFIVEPKKKV